MCVKDKGQGQLRERETKPSVSGKGYQEQGISEGREMGQYQFQKYAFIKCEDWNYA